MQQIHKPLLSLGREEGVVLEDVNVFGDEVEDVVLKAGEELALELLVGDCEPVEVEVGQKYYLRQSFILATVNLRANEFHYRPVGSWLSPAQPIDHLNQQTLTKLANSPDRTSSSLHKKSKMLVKPGANSPCSPFLIK